MLELKVTVSQHELRIPYERVETPDLLIDILETQGIFLPGACGGVGKCGLCLVRVEAGGFMPLSSSEEGALSADELQQGYRLACQARPLSPTV